MPSIEAIEDPETQLLSHLAAFLTGELSVHAFRAWFLPQEWIIDPPPAGLELMRLLTGLHARLAAFDYGLWSVNDLQASLHWLLLELDGAQPDFADPMAGHLRYPPHPPIKLRGV